MLLALLPAARVATWSVHQLATVDYTIANRATHDASVVVDWAFEHDTPWLACRAVEALQALDEAGSTLISITLAVVHAAAHM